MHLQPCTCSDLITQPYTELITSTTRLKDNTTQHVEFTDAKSSGVQFLYSRHIQGTGLLLDSRSRLSKQTLPDEENLSLALYTVSQSAQRFSHLI